MKAHPKPSRSVVSNIWNEHLRWTPSFAERVVRYAERQGTIQSNAGDLMLTEHGRQIARDGGLSMSEASPDQRSEFAIFVDLQRFKLLESKLCTPHKWIDMWTPFPNPRNSFPKRIFSLLNLIPIQCVCIACFFLLYHKFLAHWMRTASVNLGRGQIFIAMWFPLYALPQTDLSIWIFPALVVLIVFLLLCRKIFLSAICVPRSVLFSYRLGSFLPSVLVLRMIDGYRGSSRTAVACIP